MTDLSAKFMFVSIKNHKQNDVESNFKHMLQQHHRGSASMLVFSLPMLQRRLLGLHWCCVAGTH
jgi:hypothetical protein